MQLIAASSDQRILGYILLKARKLEKETISLDVIMEDMLHISEGQLSREDILEELELLSQQSLVEYDKSNLTITPLGAHLAGQYKLPKNIEDYVNKTTK